MADLIAIAAHDPRRRVSSAEIEALATTRERLRGSSSSLEVRETARARIAVAADFPGDAAGVAGADDDWIAWAGSPRPRPSTDTRLDQIDGQFALVRHSSRDRELVLAGDSLGLKPFFVADRDGLTYASTSALVLAAHLRANPSPVGIRRFVRCGSMFGPGTLWDGVRRIGPAERIRFAETSSPQRSAYWRPEIDDSMARLDFRETAAAWIDRRPGRLEDYDGTDPWADLTGGFDTRLLTLLLAHDGRSFTANTSGEGQDQDVLIAEKIATAAGWPWKLFSVPRDLTERLPSLVLEALAWGDGHLDALGLAEVVLGHRLKASRNRVILNGGGGEHLRDYPWAHELQRAGRSRTVDYERLISWRVLGPLDLSIFATDPTAEVRSDVRSDLERRVGEFPGAPNTFLGDLLYALKATGHFGAYQAATGGVIEMRLPLYERDAFIASISCAPGHRRFHRLMRQVIHDLDPALAAIETETGGPAAPLGLHNFHRFAAYPQRRLLKFGARLKGRLSPLSKPAPTGPGITIRAHARRDLLRALVDEGRLDPGELRAGSIFDGARIAELLEVADAAPLEADWTAIGRVLTIELALAAADASVL